MARLIEVKTSDALKNGKLDAVTVTWQEESPDKEKVAMLLMVAFLMPGFLLTAFVLPLAILCFALAAWAYNGYDNYKLTQRSLAFNVDGSMPAPMGFGHYPDLKAVGGSHRHIVSIESRRRVGGEGLYEVIFTSDSGKMVTVGINLPEDSALEVATTLRRQLTRLRRSLVDGRRSFPGFGEAGPDWGLAKGVID